MATAGKPIQCKAAVLWEVNTEFSIETIEVPVPGKNEVRVKMTSAGVCHSDLHMKEGCDKSWIFPTVLGHEGAGIIESVGEGVTSVAPGDLVVTMFEACCEQCDLCKDPRTQQCRLQARNNMQLDGKYRLYSKGKGLSQMGMISTFSQYTVVPVYNVTKVNPKAPAYSLCLAGCCIPTGYGAAVNAGKVTKGSTCAVWGLGGVGMCVLMGCRDSGAAKVIGIDTNPRKFELAKDFGATDFLNPKNVSSVSEALASMTNGGPDFCFVSVGIVPVMEEAFRSCHPLWGKTVVIGLADIGETMKAGVWELLFGRQLIGTYYGGIGEGRAKYFIPKLVDKIVSGQIHLDKLITHRLPLEKIEDGFKMLRTGESLRAIIDYSL